MPRSQSASVSQLVGGTELSIKQASGHWFDNDVGSQRWHSSAASVWGRHTLPWQISPYSQKPLPLHAPGVGSQVPLMHGSPIGQSPSSRQPGVHWLCWQKKPNGQWLSIKQETCGDKGTHWPAHAA